MSADSQIQSSVLAELAWEPSVLAGHIGVTVHQGVVTLTGHVASFAEKLAAEEAARRVRGVKAVAEEIQVQLPSGDQHSDEDIAAAIVDRLTWDVSIPPGRIKAMVEKGWVTLTGEVDWRYQAEAALNDVRPVQGVTGVSNFVAIKSRINAANLSDDITHALHRSWFFDPQTVTVTADDDKVRLTGTVRTPHDRQVAAATAWSAPGVTDVENDLMVA